MSTEERKELLAEVGNQLKAKENELRAEGFLGTRIMADGILMARMIVIGMVADGGGA